VNACAYQERPECEDEFLLSDDLELELYSNLIQDPEFCKANGIDFKPQGELAAPEDIHTPTTEDSANSEPVIAQIRASNTLWAGVIQNVACGASKKFSRRVFFKDKPTLCWLYICCCFCTKKRTGTFYFSEKLFSEVCQVTKKYTHVLKKSLIKQGLIEVVNKKFSYTKKVAQELRVKMSNDIDFVKNSRGFADYVSVSTLIECSMPLSQFLFLVTNAENNESFLKQAIKLERRVFFRALMLGLCPDEVLFGFGEALSIYTEESKSKAYQRIADICMSASTPLF
jgi:hypothetical protein